MELLDIYSGGFMSIDLKAFDKCLKTIESCKTWEQFCSARRYIELYLKGRAIPWEFYDHLTLTEWLKHTELIEKRDG